MNLWQHILKFFGVAVEEGLRIDDRYLAQWRREVAVANAKLGRMAYKPWDEDNELDIEVIEGTMCENGMWKRWLEVPVSSNPAGGLWVGGNATPGRITLVCDPAGYIKPGVMEHEAAHQILWDNGIHDTKHHAIMKQAGVFGR